MTEMTNRPPVEDPARAPRDAPGSRGTTALVVIGVLLFIGGWALAASAPSASTSFLSDVVNIPELVQRTAGAQLLALLGAVLLATGLVMKRIDLWGHRGEERR